MSMTRVHSDESMSSLWSLLLYNHSLVEHLILNFPVDKKRQTQYSVKWQRGKCIVKQHQWSVQTVINTNKEKFESLSLKYEHISIYLSIYLSNSVELGGGPKTTQKSISVVEISPPVGKIRDTKIFRVALADGQKKHLFTGLTRADLGDQTIRLDNEIPSYLVNAKRHLERISYTLRQQFKHPGENLHLWASAPSQSERQE